MQNKLTIKYLPIDDLTPYENNARTHSSEQVNEIARSIAKHGFTNPILLDGSNGIVAGHGRLLAAKQLGMKDVPTIDLQFTSEAAKKAYIIADNKLALNAGWDYELLRVEFDLLEDAGIDLADTGFNELEIASICNETVENAEEEWKDMPEFEQEDKMAYRTIKVHFNDDQAVDEFAKLVFQKITDKTKYIWFPQQEKEEVADIRYES